MTARRCHICKDIRSKAISVEQTVTQAENRKREREAQRDSKPRQNNKVQK